MQRTPTSFTDSVRSLRAAQKSNRGAPLYSRLVNRPVGRIFAAAAHRLGMSPNQVTAVSALFTFTGIAVVVLVPPTPATAATVALLLMVGYALDSADGQLARLLGGGSPAGEWLDHVVDAAKSATIHLAVLVSLYRFAELPSDLLLLVPLLFSVSDVVCFFGFVLTERLRRPDGPALASSERARPSVVRSLLALPTDYGLLCVVFVLLAWPTIFLTVYGLMAVGTTAYLVLALPKWYRDVARLDV